NLVQDILGSRPHVTIALNPNRHKDSDQQFREAVMQMRVLGLPLSAVDPYEQVTALEKTAHRSAVTVMLNGNNYVTDKTRKAFEDALQDKSHLTPQVEGKPAVIPENRHQAMRLQPVMESISCTQ